MRKLIISNFPPDTTEQEIARLFGDYRVELVVLKPEKYAIVTFEDDWSATRALENWHCVDWYGYRLRVKRAQW
jgi:hypothetical protein